MNPLAFLGPIFSGALGIGQFIKGLTSQPQRPIYSTPQSVLDLVDSNKRLASSNKMPGQDILENRLGESTASAISEVKQILGGGPASLGAVADIYGKEQENLAKINYDASVWKSGQQDKLNQALAMMGRYEDKAFDINQMQPYQDEAASSSALQEGGLSNIHTGLSDVSGALSWGNLLKSGNGSGGGMPDLLKMLSGGGGSKNMPWIPKQFDPGYFSNFAFQLGN